LIGAIVLTHRERRGVKRQDAGAQGARTVEASMALSRPAIGAGIDTSAGVQQPEEVA
jgi:hypothetical protein